MPAKKPAPVPAGEDDAMKPADTAAAAVSELNNPELPPLLAPTPDDNPRLSELEAALSGGSDSQPAAAAAPSDAQAAARPGFKRWSHSKRKNATRKELAARVLELEEIAAVTPPAAPSEPAAPEALSLEEAGKIAARSIEETLGVVSGIAKRMRGPHWELTAEERRALGEAWGPVAAPYLGSMVRHLPLVGALTLTGAIIWPRIERDMELAKMDAALPIGTGTKPADDPRE